MTSHLGARALVAAPGPRLRVLGHRGEWSVDGLDGQEDALRTGERPGDPGWGVDVEERRSMSWPDGDRVALERGRWDAYYPAVAASVLRAEPAPVAPQGVLDALGVLDAARDSASTGEVVHLGGALADPTG